MLRHILQRLHPVMSGAAAGAASNASVASSCENSRSVNAPHLLPLKGVYLDQIFAQFGIDV